ncbi:MAG: YIP1 family protein [Candidatus Eisenbacteria bacterium]
MEEIAVPQAASSDEAPWSFPRRFISLFTSPRALFEHLEQRPSWFVPLLVTICFVLLFVVVLWNPVMLPESLERMAGSPNAEQGEAMLTRNGLMFGIVFGGIGSVFAYLLYALFVWLVGAFMLGGRLNYRQSLSIVSHTSLLIIPAEVVRIPLAFMAGSSKVSVGPGMLFPIGQAEGFLGKFWSSLLMSFDLFTLWQTALVALAVAIVARVSTTRANLGIWSLFLVTALCFGLLGALSPN